MMLINDQARLVDQNSRVLEEFLDGRIALLVELARWCNAATVDRKDRPRSRVLHPIWEVIDTYPIGWIATGNSR
jgi:hypothetical protein